MSDMFEDFEGEALDVIEEVELSPAVEEKKEVGLSSLGLDFSALGAMPGVIVGKTGTTVSRYAVPRLKFQEDKKELISILSDDVIIAKTHYDEELGSNFLCFGGDCCNSGFPRIRYCYPVLKYTTDAKGKPITKDYEFGVLVLGGEGYETLQGVQDMKGSLTQFDFLVSCSDAKYQKCTYSEAGNARWPQIPGCKEAMQKFWKENSKDILKSVARSITPEEYNRLKGASMVPEAGNLDFDSVFG